MDEFTKGLMMVLKPLIKEVILETLEETKQDETAVDEKDELITAKDAARMLNVSKPTLWRWAKDGYLQPVKVGRKCFYHSTEINSLYTKND